MKSKLMIFVIIIVVISSFVLFFGYIGQGGVRHVQIYLPEKIESTISFQNIENETKIVGLSGISGINPTLISRTDYDYILTIHNYDEIPHMFFIDGLNAHLKGAQIIEVSFPDGSKFNKKMPDGYNDFYKELPKDYKCFFDPTKAHHSPSGHTHQ